MVRLERSPARTLPTILFTLLMLQAANLAFAQGTDLLGIHFDSNFTENTRTNTDFPVFDTGYLVLHGPSQPDVGGWECWVRTAGPVQILTWSLEGQAVNFETAPQFFVGLGSPLPLAEQVLLASFDFMVDQGGLVAFRLEPIQRSSLPGVMAYIPFEFKEPITPLGTTTGQSEVAWYNDTVPVCDLSSPSLSFGTVAATSTTDRTLTVTNIGGSQLMLDVALPGDCDAFSIVSGGGPGQLGSGESLTVRVRLEAGPVGSQACQLQIGPDCPDVPLGGYRRPPITSWTLSEEAIDFGQVAIGEPNLVQLLINNTGETVLPITPDLLGDCEAFSVSEQGTLIELDPGHWRYLQVGYLPLELGPYSCTLDLGGVLPDLPLAGIGETAAPEFRIQPSYLTYGAVGIGSSYTRGVSVINDGNVTVQVTPEIITGGDVFAISGSTATVTVAPGGRYTVRVLFAPLEVGLWSGQLRLGGGMPLVPLSGTGEVALEGWTVTPQSIDFGLVYTMTGESRWVELRNTGNVVQTTNVTLGAGGGFTLGSLAGEEINVDPGQRTSFLVHFYPVAPNLYENTLSIEGVIDIPLSGQGVANSPPCYLNHTLLEFGETVLGASVPREVYVTNTTTDSFTITPTVTCAQYHYVGPAEILLTSGMTAILPVVFNPTEAGHHQCYLDLGSTVCGSVALIGDASDGLVPTEDIVGVWFDTELTTGIRDDLDVGQSFDAWLAMLNPSETAGIGGWELKVELDEGLLLTDVELMGQAYNIESAPQFFVGIAEPLPYAVSVILARLEFLVTDELVHGIDLGPISRPSIEGRMAWVYGNDYLLKPLNPVTGLATVAWATAGEPLPVLAPTPAVLLDGATVVLTWPAPRSAGLDGCHVYRATAGREVRLTTAPLAADGANFRFLDTLADLAPGTALEYSYALVQDGVEIARSGAVRFEVPGAPVLATRLLPNRPNPFNPETEIHFELARAGNLRLTVHDVSGRRLAVLADGQHPAGRDYVTWRGRDQAGRVLPSGAYYLRLETATATDTRKIMLLK